MEKTQIKNADADKDLLLKSENKPSIEELRLKMQEKLKAIPTPKLDKKRLETIKRKNMEKDKEILDHTLKILKDRRQEAIEEGDMSKKFASIAYEHVERDRFLQREIERKKLEEYELLKKGIPEKYFKILDQFSELKDPNYWKKAIEKGQYSENDIAFYYRDLWGIPPQYVAKFRKMIKILRELEQMKK